MSRENPFEHFTPPSEEHTGLSLGADQFTRDNASAWRSNWRVVNPDADAAIFQIRQQSFEGHVAEQFEHASGVAFTTAAENAKSGEQPDFFLGEDGQLRANPNKTEPPKDGKLNIQIEGNQSNQSEIDAARVANENQKAAVREMIAYFQKFNPGAEVPRHWLDQLDKQPDLPAPKQDASMPKLPDAGVESTQQPTYQGGGYHGGGGSGGGGSGGGSGSYRGGGGERAFDPGERPVYRGDRPSNPPPVPGDMNVAGPPTITPEKIDQILKQYHSPAAQPGMGQYIYDAGVKAGINPAVALAFFIQESSAGTAGVAATTHSWGNIKGEGPAGSYHGFRAYHDYKEGVDDWYRLIKDKYLAPSSQGGFGAQTLSQIISHYAPSSDGNNERAYVANVKGMVKGWAEQTRNA